LIHVFTRTSNIDPKARTSRFVSFKFEFHSGTAATFATLSANSGREHSQQGCSYSITSSARASSVGGTERPSAFAVFRCHISRWRIIMGNKAEGLSFA
jgi:hypothetical protein